MQQQILLATLLTRLAIQSRLCTLKTHLALPLSPPCEYFSVDLDSQPVARAWESHLTFSVHHSSAIAIPFPKPLGRCALPLPPPCNPCYFLVHILITASAVHFLVPATRASLGHRSSRLAELALSHLVVLSCLPQQSPGSQLLYAAHGHGRRRPCPLLLPVPSGLCKPQH